MPGTGPGMTSLAALSLRHRQARAIRAHDPDPAAGGRVGAGDAPDGVVDPHRAGAVDDRLLQREHAADQRIRTLVEERIALACGGVLARDAAPQRYRRGGEDREHQYLQLP